jgi:hypothetical protein
MPLPRVCRNSVTPHITKIEEGQEPDARFLTINVSHVTTLTLRREPADALSRAHSRGLVGGHGRPVVAP